VSRIIVGALLLLAATVIPLSSGALGFTPRITVCGRVTALVPPTAGTNNGVITLGTQPPRTLGIGGDPSRFHVDDTVCISGVDVGSGSALGIEEWARMPLSEIGCGTAIYPGLITFRWTVTNGSTMGEISLGTTGTAGSCPRLGVGAAGNPVVLAGATAPPATSAPPAPTAIGALPSTSTASGGGPDAADATSADLCRHLHLAVWSAESR
jgi:hypothetical protein